MSDIHVSALYIYPIKSTRGIRVDEAAVTTRGLFHDRRWMVVDPQGSFLTQRTLPRLALIESRIDGQHLVVHAPGMRHLPLPLAGSRGDLRRVIIWKDACDAIPVGVEAAQWFSEALGLACELVFMPESTERHVDPAHAAAGDLVSFADGYPLLLTSTASVEVLASRIGAPVAMERFRPNLVVTGSTPDVEDTWRRIVVGDLPFRVAKACARCAIPTLDPWTLEKGVEPLKTLSTYRSVENKVLFGQNLIPDALGTVHIGDAVRVLESAKPVVGPFTG